MPHSKDEVEQDSNPDLSVGAQKNVTFPCLPFMIQFQRLIEFYGYKDPSKQFHSTLSLQTSICSFLLTAPLFHKICAGSWLFQAPGPRSPVKAGKNQAETRPSRGSLTRGTRD